MVNRWIWQEPNWPKFHWDAPRLAPVLHSAHTQRLELQQLLNELDAPLIPEASAELISRESLSTAGIEGEQLGRVCKAVTALSPVGRGASW